MTRLGVIKESGYLYGKKGLQYIDSMTALELSALKGAAVSI